MHYPLPSFSLSGEIEAPRQCFDSKGRVLSPSDLRKIFRTIRWLQIRHCSGPQRMSIAIETSFKREFNAA